MKKFTLFILSLLFLGTFMANAQTKVITGTVISSEDQLPIPGVSVSVAGTTLGIV